MIPVGYILLAFGLILTIYWQVRFLAIAYDRSLWWLLGCLFIPFADFLFFVLHFRATRKAFGLCLVGLAIAGFGGWMAGITWQS
jgi:hypothetical protein